MNEDPIVTEVRRIRDRRASRCGYDIHKIFADLMARRDVEDPSHPTVENADEWVPPVAAEDVLTLREEPPRDV
jgi:hypothetical protein